MFNRALLLAAAVLFVGCGSESTTPGTTTDDAATDDTASTVEDTGATDDTAVEEVALPAPLTPRVVSLVKMGGNLHVSWKNNDTGLTKIELFRKKGAGEYAVAYTYTKAATSQHDSGAYGTSTFCYKVRTTRGELQSEFSNEMCGTP